MQLQAVSEAAASAETARAVAVSELELRRAVGSGGRTARRAGARAAGRNVLGAVGASVGEEQRAVPHAGRLQAQRGPHGHPGRSLAAPAGDRATPGPAERDAGPLRAGPAGHGSGAQGRLRHLERAGGRAAPRPRAAAARDPEPRHGVAVPADARTLGRNDAAQRGQGGRHGRALRLRGATVDHDGGRPAPSGHDRAPARRRPGRDRLQGPSGRLLEVHRVRRRGRAQGVPQEARRTVAHPRGSAGQEGVLEAVRALARVRGRLHPRRVAAGGGLRG